MRRAVRVRIAVRVDKPSRKIYIFTGRKSMRSFLKHNKGVYLFKTIRIDNVNEFVEDIRRTYDVEAVVYKRKPRNKPLKD